MIIQASHLNSTFVQQNQDSDQQSGFGSLFGASAQKRQNTQAASTSPKLTIARPAALQTPATAMNDRVDAFGSIMDSYLKGFTDEKGAEKDSSGLVGSLEDTVRWIEEQYGKDAATTAMGMVVQSAASGQSEQAIGDGLLNTLKMIDRNFGINASDTAIAKFNSGVNKELNSFFDNGSQEVFHAKRPAQGTDSVSNVSSRVLTQTAATETTDEEETVDLTEELLAALEKELSEQSELQSLSHQLENKLSPEALTSANGDSALMNKALAAYAQPAATPQAQVFSAMA
jgi:hypothetical protein